MMLSSSKLWIILANGMPIGNHDSMELSFVIEVSLEIIFHTLLCPKLMKNRTHVLGKNIG